MRISYKVWLVGGIPILIAAAIASISWWLLSEAERARDGAVRAGATFRNLTVALAARDYYVQALPGGRAEYAVQFGSLAEQVRAELAALSARARDRDLRTAADSAREALAQYERRMRQFMVVITNNDHLAAEMRGRMASLVTLTDRARERQRASNADIIASLTQKGRQQRAIRNIVDKAQEVRAQIATISLQELQRNYGTSWDQISSADAKLMLGLSQLRVAATELTRLLGAEDRKKEAGEVAALVKTYDNLVADPGDPAKHVPDEGPKRGQAGQALSDWLDRLVTIYASEERALHDEVTQLLTYAVEANETERATQSVAIETLKISQRTSDALARRDPNVAIAILADGRDLAATVDRLPISPLIQTEMIEALEQWRSRLSTAIEGLRTQNQMILDMDATGAAMLSAASALNDTFAEEANRIGEFVRTILLAGAGFGLLLGSGAAFFVARSITRPLQDLQQDMVRLAGDPSAGPIHVSQRRDELGDMARAANFFVTEIGHREHALLEEKNKADRALAELQRTQSDLIQSEKLASLGQLVAGVAHEINTPVGIALTTATTLSEEVRGFGEATQSGQVSRQRFAIFVDRVREGSQLLFTNLTRAAELVQSFKQVAADQVSSERRAFEMDIWARELLTSLRPALRKSAHRIDLDCPPGLLVDTYPGALAQVLTNLVMNSITHAFAKDNAGVMRLSIHPQARGEVRIDFSDNGRGIPEQALGKIFDPFFTTARNRGSTGLGLHIVYNLVTSVLQGRIEAASPAGSGAQFTITLPVRIAEQQPEKVTATA